MKISDNHRHVNYSRWEESFIIDKNTGEVIATLPPKKSSPAIPHSDKLVGEDLCFPTLARTEEQLIESVKQLDGYINCPVEINLEYLLEHDLSARQQRFIVALCKKVRCWNYVFTTAKELDILFGGVSRNAIKKLSFLIRVERHVPYRDDCKITIHPHLVWKGGRRHKSYAVKRWLQGSDSTTRV